MKPQKPTVDEELELLQRETFDYFLHETNPANGLVIDKTADHWPASIAATGLALSAYPVAVEHGYMTRAAAAERALTTLRFFWNSPQGTEPDAVGYKGFYYHFLDMDTGRRAWQCELSTIDTALLLAGMLTAGCYFDANTAAEQEIRQLADALYRRADWEWAQNETASISQGWKPEDGFIKYQWQGYDEALILLTLGLGSPTHPLSANSYAAWTSSYTWRNCYGYDYLYAGPLFTHQLSHIWIDFRGIRDAFMRKKNCDYFENSRRATFVQQQYAIANPLKFAGYSKNCWGITASDGPGPTTLTVNGVKRQFFDYVARGIPDGPDDGTISPWVVAASLPFAPEIVLPALDYFINHVKLKEANPYGFKTNFNPTYPANTPNPYGWISPYHCGLNQGPIILMIENHRTDMLWSLMRSCPYIVSGLQKAGFTGGWLQRGD
ncbi:MAG: glucoamylase family protein [Gammaproteobacteria bacterium]